MMIQSLTADSLAPAAQLLAASMRDNPLHQRLFCTNADRLEPMLARAFLRLLRVQLRTGQLLGAYDQAQLVGVVGMAAPGHCQPRLAQKAALLPVLARGQALRQLPRIHRWLREWARQDPEQAHWHLGPAAVARDRQGQGVGTMLMEAVCQWLDEHRAPGYLETDKYDNVRLYRRGGFEVLAEHDVLGVKNWFMLRQPGSAPDRR